MTLSELEHKVVLTGILILTLLTLLAMILAKMADVMKQVDAIQDAGMSVLGEDSKKEVLYVEE